MKNFIIIIILSLAAFSQVLHHEVLVVNVEVPVRVFKGGKFIDDLTIDDFVVYEEGVHQEIQAVYLIKKTGVERKEDKKIFFPETVRNFYLFFEISHYTPKLKNSLRYFLENVLLPKDNLTVVTPMKTYRMKNKAFQMLSKEKLVSQLENILRKDALRGNSEYRRVVKELVIMTRILSSVIGGEDTLKIIDPDIGFESTTYSERSIDEYINIYVSLLNKLENLRKVDQRKFLDLAEYLKNEQGQKYVFLFYEREFIPQISTRILVQYLNMYQDYPDIIHKLTYLSEFIKRDLPFDVERIKKAYSDSSITIHFLFFTQPRKQIYDVQLQEHSEDIFRVFQEMAQATGGTIEISANPDYLFQRAAEASETYYLLYYAPKDYKPDGKFKNIKVEVKDKNYKITYRAGYFAK